MSFGFLTPNNIGGPLTTVFTPPADCFSQLPETWSTCNTCYGSTGHDSIYGLNCYWSQPQSCYPTGAQVKAWFGNSFTYAVHYFYSPGVLPSGFSGLGQVVASGSTAEGGCLSYVSSLPNYSARGKRILMCSRGWEARGPRWCSSAATLQTYSLGSAFSVGQFAAVLPRVQVYWAASDLTSFSPPSAPILAASSTPAQPVSSSMLASATVHVTSTTKETPSMTSAASTLPASTNLANQSDRQGLSTGAKAGIGVGAAIGVLSILVVGYLFFRRSRRRNREDELQRSRVSENHRPYMDARAELVAGETWATQRNRTSELQDKETHIPGYHGSVTNRSWVEGNGPDSVRRELE